MAKGQQQGISAVTVWLILFVALWLLSTIFLVILYTGQEELTTENSRLKSANRKLISPSEEKSLELVKNAQESGPTVVGLIEDARAQTATVACGEAGANAAAVRTRRDGLLELIQTDAVLPKAETLADASYHDALTRVYEGFKNEVELRKASETRASELEAQVQGLVEAAAKQKADFEARATEVSQLVTQVEADRAAYRGERDKLSEKLERDFDETRKRCDADLTRERQQRALAEKRSTELQRRLSSFQERFGDLMIGPERLATARQADGKILTAVPGDDSVYINLGRPNGLVLGLQFAVYSAQTGIPEDGRGKAKIEVVSVHPSSAECRVLGVAPNEIIVEGDLIANPVYDPHRPMTFVVTGEFDIDKDGKIDPSGAEVMEALVTKWGAKVSQELTPLTDFVVLGASPRRPRASTEAGSDLQADPKDPVRLAWNRYNDLSERANALSIPILTQDVFLNFLDYRGRGILQAP